jgi:ferritin-like metal-binding protein YciE
VADQELNERDTKLVQWLREAHAKEAELEANLTAHIALTQKKSYRQRLQRHLTETRTHKRQVAARIKKFKAPLTAGPLPGPIAEAAGKTVASVKGQVGLLRSAVGDQAETHLRNAQEELREEHVEIALYTRIETFATEVGDTETAKMAKAIRRDEERMAKYLSAELPRLVKELVRAEVPRDQRRQTTSRSTRSRASTTTRRATATRRSTGGTSSGGRPAGGTSGGRQATRARARA